MRIHLIALALLCSLPCYPNYSIDLELNPPEFVSCMFTDLTGTFREVIIPYALLNKAEKDGLNFDGSSIPGMTDIRESDLTLKLNMDTVAPLPWTEDTRKTVRIICDVYRDEHTPYEGDPRSFLKSAIEEAHALGYDFLVGPELEFFLCKDNDFSEPLTPCDSQRYFSAEQSLTYQSFKTELFTLLLAQGIPIEKLHHEVAPGQHEMSIKYANALTMADYIVTAKHTIRMCAKECDLKATFMPKPFAGMNGNGMHINFSLWDRNKNCNVFYDAEHPAKLSVIAQQFLAGVIYHISELNVICNPTVNSYKRLIPGFEAPVNICWGTKNRSAMIRIPRINEDQANALRGEIRSPDATCNPYLAFGALLKAGLDGIKKEMKLAPAVDDNLYHLTNQERITRNIPALPTSLDQALTLFTNSTFAQELFGATLCTEFIKCKQKEIDDYSRIISNWELQQLFDA